MKKRYIAAALTVPAAALSVFTAELYRYTFCRDRGWLMPIIKGEDAKGHGEDYYIVRDTAAEKLRDFPSERMYIRSARGNRLCGWYYRCGEGNSERIAMIIHGYRSNHLENGGLYYEDWLKRGFDVFMADNTAHGESEGEIIGYDCYEWQDSLLWLDHLHERFPQAQIALHGFSMGGATVLKLSSRVPYYVKFIIDDCGYSSAQELLKFSLGRLYTPVRHLNRLIAGYDVEESDVREDVKNAKVPILFFHGEEDKLVPFAMGPVNFDACTSEKEAHFVPGARHVESRYIDPEGYGECIDRFIGKYM